MRRGNKAQPSTTQAADTAVPEVVPALDAFVSESALPRTPSRSDQPTHPLWQFPEERRSASGSYLAVRQLAIYAALVAAILVCRHRRSVVGTVVPFKTSGRRSPDRASSCEPTSRQATGCARSPTRRDHVVGEGAAIDPAAGGRRCSLCCASGPRDHRETCT